MSSELRLKKLRGSGGYVMANINDEQQMKGNLGGPDLFLAPIGRLNKESLSKYFCNTCEKEFEGAPKIQYENPNEEVAENLILAEKGQYLCDTCDSTIAEYRNFKKQDEKTEIGNAKPIEPQKTKVTEPQKETPVEAVTEPQKETVVEPQEAKPEDNTSVSSIDGRSVYDEDANKVGVVKQIGINANQSLVLLITKNDGTETSIPWDEIKKIGEIVLIGKVTQNACTSCGFVNKEGSKFCEECGNKL